MASHRHSRLANIAVARSLYGGWPSNGHLATSSAVVGGSHAGPIPTPPVTARLPGRVAGNSFFGRISGSGAPLATTASYWILSGGRAIPRPQKVAPWRRWSYAAGGQDARPSGDDACTVEGVEERPPRLSDEEYLKHVEELANVICDAAFDEGWLTFLPDDADQSPLQQAINESARAFVTSTTRATAASMRAQGSRPRSQSSRRSKSSGSSSSLQGRWLVRTHTAHFPPPTLGAAEVARYDSRRHPRTLRRVADGTVAVWHGDEGWGAIRAPGRRGVGFAHFSHIRGVEGYREMFVGEQVEFEWADDFAQDGCQWRVAWVRPVARSSNNPE